MWFKKCFNISLTLLLIFFTQSISAASKECKSFTANSSEFKQLKNININTIKNRRFQTNNINILIDPRKSILNIQIALNVVIKLISDKMEI